MSRARLNNWITAELPAGQKEESNRHVLYMHEKMSCLKSTLQNLNVKTTNTDQKGKLKLHNMDTAHFSTDCTSVECLSEGRIQKKYIWQT